MQKLIETLNSGLKLVTTLIILAVLGGFIYGGLCVYRWVAETTSKPIQVPEFNLPEKLAMPEIKVPMPEIKVPDIGEGIRSAGDELGKALGVQHEEPKDSANNLLDFSELENARCAHSPKCSTGRMHVEKFCLKELCTHSPACDSMKVFEERHAEELFKACRHSCTGKYRHFMRFVNNILVGWNL